MQGSLSRLLSVLFADMRLADSGREIFKEISFDFSLL